MGIFDVFTTTNPMDDFDRGRAALVYFNNQMVRDYSDWPYNVDTLIDAIKKNFGGNPQRNGDFFVTGVGTTINSVGMPERKIKSAMETLADMSKGNLPNNPDVFSKALSDRATTITTADFFSEELPDVAEQSAMDVASGAQAIGNSVIATGKTLNMIAPVLIVAAVVFIGWNYTKRLAS